MTQNNIPVPCGKCPECQKRRISSWSFRLMQESKVSSSMYFITLTYDTQHVAITRNGYMTVKKEDLQLFFKRLRKRNPETKIKYYAAAEYGGKTKRPHYHIILFNAKIDSIQPAWELGNVHYGHGKVSEAEVGYTLKYICKENKIPLHRNDDRTPEFSLMSKGLGLNYITEHIKAWHKADKEERMYCNLPDNKKIAMPRYYKDKIYNEHERKAISAHHKLKHEEILTNKINNETDFFHNRATATIGQFKRANYLNNINRDKL